MDGALFIDEQEQPAASKEQAAPIDDDKPEQAADALVGLLEHMGLEADVEIREDDERVVLDIDGPDSGRAIGKKGQTLDALQFLVNKMVNRFPEGRRHIVVDCGDYRERRDNGLISMARREAKRAVQQSRVVTLEPMSPRDRRVVHLSLAKFPGVSTRSDGQGAGRRVRIIPSGGRAPRRQSRR